MNWVDIIIIIVLTYYVCKGLRLGLISSIFSIANFLISAYIAKSYYYYIYQFIIDNILLYGIFEKITGVIMRLLFYSRIDENPDFLFRLLTEGLVKLIIGLTSIILIFCLSTMFLKAVFSIFSFLFKTPVLKSLNRMGGMVFGLIQGIVLVYIFNIIFSKLYAFLPETNLGDAISNSLILTYLQTVDILSFLLDFGNNNYI